MWYLITWGDLSEKVTGLKFSVMSKDCNFVCNRFVSVERGFNYLSSLGYLNQLLEQWRTVGSKECVCVCVCVWGGGYVGSDGSLCVWWWRGGVFVRDFSNKRWSCIKVNCR